MSIQLVLFPQTGTSNELMVDALDFSTVDFATNHDTTTSGSVFQHLIFNESTPNVGSWRRFRWTTNGTTALPDGTAGTLVLDSNSVASSAGTFSGVYQRLSGLTVGQSYELTINLTPLAGPLSTLTISAWSASTGYPSQTFSTNVSQVTFTWNALSITDTIFIGYRNNTGDKLTILDMSVLHPATEYLQGQVICDLYEDEEIPLTLSVDNFKNVAEKIQSYSKDFNLPATKRNNKIFSNLFQITRTVANPYDFNPYITTRAVLKQDGIILFDGSLRLIDIQDREGEISYNVNLYAQTIALADDLKNKTFDDINFDELEHTYNKTVIKGSWNTNGLTLENPLPTGTYAGTAGASVTDVLKYPFVDWTGQILYANGATGNNATAGTPELTSLEQAFRPWIKIKYLIDRIFSEAGYTYSSTLFDSTDFGKLFMDFNWGGSSMPVDVAASSFTATYPGPSGPSFVTDTTFLIIGLIDSTITGGQVNSHTPPTYVDTVGDADRYKIVETTTNQLYEIDYTWWFSATAAGTAVPFFFRWQHYVAATGVTETHNFTEGALSANVDAAITGTISILLNTGDKLFPEFSNSTANNIEVYNGGTTSKWSKSTFNISTAIVKSTTLNTLRGEINQWEFLKGIMTMFNLVTLQDKTDPANIIIKTYKDVFITTTKGLTLAERSVQHDWTDKIDIKDIQLTPLNDLKKTTVFKFEEDDDDYVFKVYKRATRGHLYGSKVFSAENLTLLEGEDEIVAKPFAATVSKPIWGNLSSFIIPTIYSLNDDGTSDPFDNKPRILYQTSPSGGEEMSSSYYIVGQNGLDSENQFYLFTFSHLTDIPTLTDTEDYNFGECQYFQPIGQTVPNNLFNTYWLPYYNQLYNPDTKTMELKVNLQPSDIATFKFSDHVMIRNRAYRVNRIDYKPKDLSTVEFILIV